MDNVTRTCRNVKYLSAADWPSTPEIDGVRYATGPDPADAQWWAEQNDGWDGHPTIDEQTAADEAAYRADEARRFAADPTPEEIDQWANESETLSMMERGIRPF